MIRPLFTRSSLIPFVPNTTARSKWTTRAPLMRAACLALIAATLATLSHVPAGAAWKTNGVSVSDARVGPQAQPGIVSDGAGGVIVVWRDEFEEEPGSDIYAQRFDGAGNRLWEADGVPVCRAADWQADPRIVPDGVGGAIVYWADDRDGSYDIYAQRIDGTGASLWAEDGVAITTGGGNGFPIAVSLGSGASAGMSIVAWVNSDCCTDAVYVQKVSATGVPLWAAGGTPVNPLARGQISPDLRPFAGGAVVVWSAADDIFAQRFDAAGAAMWTVGGKPVCTDPGYQASPRISGPLAVAWEDYRGGVDLDIYAQLLDSASGAALWDVDGVPVCVAVGHQGFVRVVPSGISAAFFVWQDPRGADIDIYGQLLWIQNGSPAWDIGGVPLTAAPGDQTAFDITFNTAELAWDLAWRDTRSGSQDIYTQRVPVDVPPSPPLWDPVGVAVCASPGNQVAPVILSSATNSLLAWSDPRDPDSGFRVFTQRIDSTGTPSWATNGNSATPSNADELSHEATTTDGAEGVIAVWEDRRRGELDIFANRMDALGDPVWGRFGTAACKAPGDQSGPTITSDGVGGAFVAWSDDRLGGDPEIYAQHVSPTGEMLWAADGVLVCSAVGGRGAIRIVSDTFGGAILCWSDSRSGDSDVYVQHLDAAGLPTLAADGVALSAAVGDQVSPQMVSPAPGQAVVVWVDNRAGNPDIYAHHLDALGSPDPLWPVDGAPVCIHPSEQGEPQINEGLVIVWRDARGLNLDIYADRISATTGGSLWATGGVVVCGAFGDQRSPKVVRTASGGGNSIVAWEDSRGPNVDIYAQRLSTAGAASWVTNGVEIVTFAGDQRDLSLASDPAGGAVLAWADLRVGSPDIFGQRISATGAPMWTLDGLSICAGTFDQDSPEIVSVSSGGGIAVWGDPRKGSRRIYAMRIAPEGGLYETAVEEVASPVALKLAQNSPNPFNPSTRIEFSLPRSGRARVDIFDAQGKWVDVLLNEERGPGPHSVVWHGTDSSGRNLPSGIYFCRLDALDLRLTRKMVLIK